MYSKLNNKHILINSGNYKKIAHIRETGHIKWYIDPESYVPEKEKQRILQVATGEPHMNKFACFSAVLNGKTSISADTPVT